MAQEARKISFPYDRSKATHAALWLLNKHGGEMHKLQLVKLLFFADREHLAQYGRPITGGSYFAMKYGPVCSEFLNDINAAISPTATLIESRVYKLFAKVTVDEDILSESDIEILEKVEREYGKYDRFALADITHTLKAWVSNYPDINANTSYPLPYEDFFLDLEDNSILELICDEQEAWNELG
jgi:uncharacterized phage-associated protein